MLNNKRTTLGPPLALNSKPSFSLDLATRFPKPPAETGFLFAVPP